MNRSDAIILGIILLVLAFIVLAFSNFVFGGLGLGAGYIKADATFLVGATLLGLGLFAMTRRKSS